MAINQVFHIAYEITPSIFVHFTSFTKMLFANTFQSTVFNTHFHICPCRPSPTQHLERLSLVFLIFWSSMFRISSTPSIPNYKSFQESWRVKASQVWPNLYDKIITFMIPTKGLFGRALAPLEMAPVLAPLEELKPFWKTLAKRLFRTRRREPTARSRAKLVFETSPAQAKNGSGSWLAPHTEPFPKQTFGTAPAGAGAEAPAGALPKRLSVFQRCP